MATGRKIATDFCHIDAMADFKQHWLNVHCPTTQETKVKQNQRNVIDKRLKQSLSEQIMTLKSMNRQS